MIIKEYIGFLDEVAKEKKKQEQAIKRKETQARIKISKGKDKK